MRRLVMHTKVWRNEMVAAYMDGYRRRDILLRGAPRTHVKIDVSLTIVLRAVAVARVLFASHPKIIADTVCASMLLGLCFGLRPGDYLYPHDKRYTDKNNCLDASQFAFIFPSSDDPIQITSPEMFPPGESPVYMICLPDFDKGHPLGRLGMRAIKAMRQVPGQPEVHCSVTIIFNYFKLHPASPGGTLFSSFPVSTCLYQCVRRVLKDTAIALGLDPRRVLPHGLRAGVITQLNSMGHSKEAKQRATGHASEAGLNAYERAALTHADDTVLAINNTNPVTVGLLRFMYNTDDRPAKKQKKKHDKVW